LILDEAARTAALNLFKKQVLTGNKYLRKIFKRPCLCAHAIFTFLKIKTVDSPTETATNGGGDVVKDKYVAGSTVRATFDVSASTLRQWSNSGRISVVRMSGSSGKRLYLVSDVEKAFKGFKPRGINGSELVGKKKISICYCRVSSAPQRDDLERQERALREEFPDHEIVKDVGSGLNWKRPGFLSVVDRAMRGDVGQVVVSHRDRLCRFGFEFVKHVLAQSGCSIVVQHDREESASGNADELRDDLLAVVTCFVASNNGKRAAANRRARRASADKARERARQAAAVDAREAGESSSETSEGDEMQEDSSESE
jgi:predicted site-specific integrase-resolvase